MFNKHRGFRILLFALCLSAFMLRADAMRFQTPRTLNEQPMLHPAAAVPPSVQSAAPQVNVKKLVSETSEVDFSALQRKNPDVYAWLRIAGTAVDYPICQREDDDEYYLSHSDTGAASGAGAIFTQKTYNTKTFDDPCTLIYGHRRSDGSMFGSLQSLYGSAEAMAQNSTIEILLPEETRTYRVFGSVCFHDRHILWKYDFSQEEDFDAFFRKAAEVGGDTLILDEENAARFGDEMVILSTCVRDRPDRRFLVMAGRTDED